MDIETPLNNFLKQVTSRSVLTKVAEEVRTLIVRRTRKGFGVRVFGGDAVKLKPLAASTISRRKRIQLSSKTSPGKSNLTETGEMLDSLIADVIGNKIRVRFANASASKKASFNEEARPFLSLTARDLQRIERLIKGAIK